MHRYENGIRIEFTPEEETAELARWATNEALAAQQAKSVVVDQALSQKYPDVLKTLDAICQKLGVQS